ncbi:hypothetical protein FQZ97_919420 [compost metagenome]
MNLVGAFIAIKLLTVWPFPSMPKSFIPAQYAWASEAITHAESVPYPFISISIAVSPGARPNRCQLAPPRPPLPRQYIWSSPARTHRIEAPCPES